MDSILLNCTLRVINCTSENSLPHTRLGKQDVKSIDASLEKTWNHHQRLIQMPSPTKIESLWVFVGLMVGVLSTFLGNFFPTVSCQSATGLLPLVNVTQRCRQHFPRETKVATDMDLTNHKKRKENLFSSNFIGKHWFCAAWIFNHSVCTLCTFQIAFVIGAVAIFCQKHLEICCLNFPVQNQ